MGIGGWLSTAQQFILYSEIFTAEQVCTEWPQLIFPRLAATCVQFDVEHLAGEKNTWADAEP
ncbi:hypothetical protein AK812_SmicGene48663, partial [Symbiodinium microadriaticum]